VLKLVEQARDVYEVFQVVSFQTYAHKLTEAVSHFLDNLDATWPQEVKSGAFAANISTLFSFLNT
jgi:hypothetical protein